MQPPFRIAGAAACLLLGAAAQATPHATHHTLANAADPQAAVPATRYQSPFVQAEPPAPATTPDAGWVASNATVGAIDSMALTMKPRPGHSADPHAGHAGHGKQATQDQDKKRPTKEAP